MCRIYQVFSFFFNDTATTEIYTLSLHDALPIYKTATTTASVSSTAVAAQESYCLKYHWAFGTISEVLTPTSAADRKSTRLNSSHANISYAVFCLKKKKLLTFYRLG